MAVLFKQESKYFLFSKKSNLVLAMPMVWPLLLIRKRGIAGGGDGLGGWWWWLVCAATLEKTWSFSRAVVSSALQRLSSRSGRIRAKFCCCSFIAQQVGCGDEWEVGYWCALGDIRMTLSGTPLERAHSLATVGSDDINDDQGWWWWLPLIGILFNESRSSAFLWQSLSINDFMHELMVYFYSPWDYAINNTHCCEPTHVSIVWWVVERLGMWNWSCFCAALLGHWINTKKCSNMYISMEIVDWNKLNHLASEWMVWLVRRWMNRNGMPSRMGLRRKDGSTFGYRWTIAGANHITGDRLDGGAVYKKKSTGCNGQFQYSSILC